MRVSDLVFRLRMPIHLVLVLLAVWAPWVGPLGLERRISLLEWLALETSRLGLLSFAAATPTVILAGALVAAVGAALRIWANAWLGSEIVVDSKMHGSAIVTDGPFRYLRNPLYLGLWFVFAAMSLAFTPSGALFLLVTVIAFDLLLIFGEEAFLTARLGETYRAYQHAVPRLYPRLRATLAPTGRKPRWAQGFLGELFPCGVFITVAGFSWSYNNLLMSRALLISFGISFVVRAFIKKPAQA